MEPSPYQDITLNLALMVQIKRFQIKFLYKNQNLKLIKMEINFFRRISMALILLAGILVSNCTQNPTPEEKPKPASELTKNVVKYQVTFIELGSVRCIPCQQMQSVMKSIEEKYAGQVKVIFHDVWTPEGKPFGEKYGIEAIPTQVFLDENGKEYFRHLGYFPEKELVKILNMKGVK